MSSWRDEWKGPELSDELSYAYLRSGALHLDGDFTADDLKALLTYLEKEMRREKHG